MSSKPSRGDGSQKRCFVVMGFGEKIDFQTGRKLNLNASYESLIKPAVEAAGLECLRADEIASVGQLDRVIYEHLLTADLVIADLSTYNANAFYELGVRHALRPFSTILIGEDKLTYPFDTSFLVIRRYQHLGDDISVREAMRFTKELTIAITEILSKEQVDSPVYQYLHLVPPRANDADGARGAQPPGGTRGAPAPPPVFEPDPKSQRFAALTQRLTALADEAEKAVAGERFKEAGSRLDAAVELLDEEVDGETFTPPPVLVQRLVRAAAQISSEGRGDALERARQMLEGLSPTDSTDPETLELLGDIEFAMFDHGGQVPRLARARRAYEKLHTLSPNHRTGVILAYIVSLHAQHRKGLDNEVYDVLSARQLWLDAVKLGNERLAQIKERYRLKGRPTRGTKSLAHRKSEAAAAKLPVLESMAEAYYGLCDKENYEAALADAALLPGGQKVVKAVKQRFKLLESMIERHEALLSALEHPDKFPWPPEKPRPSAPAGGVEKEKKRRGAPAPPEGRLIFFSYAHNDRDTKHLDEIQKTLAPSFRNSKVRLWDDRQIEPGQKWRDAIEDALSRAEVGVLLVSRDFLNSEFIAEKELPSLLKGAEKRGVKMLWVAAGKSLVDRTEIADFQALNDPKNPLSGLDEKVYEDEIVSICEKISNAVLPKMK